jgi:ABC-type lipoprotein export system ATPase subunit
LLLADEPTGNLDRDNADAVLAALAEFARAGGAVLLVTHDESVRSVAQRCVRLRNGRVEC